MDDAIGGFDVGDDDVGVVDLDCAVGDGEGDRAALEGGGFQTVGHIRGHDLTAQHMVEQDLGQVTGRVGDQGIQCPVGQGGKGGVSRRKDGEGAFALEGVHQTGGLHCGDQGAEVLIRRSDVDNVARRGLGSWFRGRFRGRFRRGRHDDRINHMDDAVAGLDVGDDDVGVVDLDCAVGDGEGDRAALEGGGFQTVGHIRGHDLTAQHMVEQDLGQVTGRVGDQGIQCPVGQGGKGGVSRRKDGEGAFALEGVHQTGGLHCGDQGAEIFVGRCNVNDVLRFLGLDAGDGGHDQE